MRRGDASPWHFTTNLCIKKISVVGYCLICLPFENSILPERGSLAYSVIRKFFPNILSLQATFLTHYQSHERASQNKHCYSFPEPGKIYRRKHSKRSQS